MILAVSTECLTTENERIENSMSTRDHISLTTKLAAAICELLAIPHEHAKLMSEDQVLSLVQWDHYPIRKADGGEDKHYNIVPKTIMAHREKTSEIDVPQIAKAKRIRANGALHEAALASKAGNYQLAAQILATAPKPKHPGRKISSRPFPKGHRPLRGRNSFERRTG